MALTEMKQLKDYPVVFDLPVQWGDQDAFNHVNNVVYLRWCETARIYYLERIGLWGMLRTSGIGCILAHLDCNYRQPVAFPDTVHIGARVTKIGNSSFQMEHVIFSDALGLVADADSTLVVYDYNLKKSCPMPEEIRAAITALEKGAAPGSKA
jgi:acyl-CoA thioester hydrolase